MSVCKRGGGVVEDRGKSLGRFLGCKGFIGEE